MLYFHLLPFVNKKQYVEGEMSRSSVYVYILAFIVHLIFLLWKYVDNDQPLIHLLIPCLFALSPFFVRCFIFWTFVILGWSLSKYKIYSGSTYCIVIMCLTMTIDKERCILNLYAYLFHKKKIEGKVYHAFLLHFFLCT